MTDSASARVILGSTLMYLGQGTSLEVLRKQLQATANRHVVWEDRAARKLDAALRAFGEALSAPPPLPAG